jgi:hypothetical protein
VVVFLIIGTIAGILVGLRFKIFVLLPMFILATVVIIITGHELKVIALTMLGTVVLLQTGYIVGCVVRFYARAYLQTRTTSARSSNGF